MFSGSVRQCQAARVDDHSLGRVAATSIALGAYIGSLAVSLADVERSMHASHTRLGVLLAVGMLGAAGANAVVSVLAHRHGGDVMLTVCLAVWAAALIAGAATTSPTALAVIFVVVIIGAGATDIVMNAVALSALSASPDRLLRFHSMYSFGAAGGALGVGFTLASGLSWRWAWVALGVAFLAIAFWPGAKVAPLQAASADDEHVSLTASLRSLVRERLLVVMVAFSLVPLSKARSRIGARSFYGRSCTPGFSSVRRRPPSDI